MAPARTLTFGIEPELAWIRSGSTSHVDGPFVSMIPVSVKRDCGSLCVMEVIGLPHIVNMSGNAPHALRLGFVPVLRYVMYEWGPPNILDI